MTLSTNSSITSCSVLSFRSRSASPGPSYYSSLFCPSVSTTIVFWCTISLSGSSTTRLIDRVFELSLILANDLCLATLFGFGSSGLVGSDSLRLYGVFSLECVILSAAHSLFCSFSFLISLDFFSIVNESFLVSSSNFFSSSFVFISDFFSESMSF